MLTKPNRYRIEIINPTYHIIEVNGQGAKNFITPDTKTGIPKLYVVKDGKDICYVGITSQSMSARFRTGFQEEGHYGYHGYKWKDKLKEADVLIWHFIDQTSIIVEAIEGELVYFIREKTGEWPKYQMEIHFHHEVTEEERQIARLILDSLFD